MPTATVGGGRVELRDVPLERQRCDDLEPGRLQPGRRSWCCGRKNNCPPHNALLRADAPFGARAVSRGNPRGNLLRPGCAVGTGADLQGSERGRWGTKQRCTVGARVRASWPGSAVPCRSANCRLSLRERVMPAPSLVTSNALRDNKIPNSCIRHTPCAARTNGTRSVPDTPGSSCPVAANVLLVPV